MGVVYKLKQEVIDFIVNQKKDNLDLSCRKISDAIKAKFLVEVSKSSVNAIIKQSSLSSPVGRRSKSPSKAQKFKIPEERKAGLFIEKEAVIHLLEEKPLPLLGHKDDTKTMPQVKPEFAFEKTDKIDISKPLDKNVPSEAQELSKKIELPSVKEEPPSVILLPAAESGEPIKEQAFPSEPAKEELPPSEPAKEELSPVEPVKEAIAPPVTEELPVVKDEIVEEKITDPIVEFQEPSPGPVIKPEPSLQAPEPLAPKPEALEPTPSAEESVASPEEETDERPHLRLDPIQATPPAQPPAVPEAAPEGKTDVKIQELEAERESLAPATQEKKKEEAPPPVSVEPPMDPMTSKEPPSKPVNEKLKEEEKIQSAAAPAKETESPQKKPYVDDRIWTPGTETFTPPEKAEVVQKETKRAFIDGMGCFFLKAAEWELSNSSVLGGLLRKHSNAYLGADINELSEVLLYLEAFGVKNIEDLKSDNQEGLWVVNDVKQKPLFDVLSKSVESIASLKSLAVAMTNEYTQLFSEISYIKISFNDNTDVCFDAQMRSIWYENNVQSVFNLPLNKALQFLSTNLISNVQPVIFCNIPGYKSFARQFYDFTAAFENTGEKTIAKIGIFDGHKEEIAKFTLIPAKKRSFIAGAWPWQEECKKFIEDDMRLIQNFHHGTPDKEIYYSELKTKLDQSTIGQTVNVRVALIRETGLSWPYLIIVTNIPEQAMPLEDVISAYLTRWPNLQEGYNDFTAKTERASYGVVTVAPAHNRVPLLKGEGQYNLLLGSTDFWACAQFLLSALNNYSQRHFFPPHYEKLDFPSIKERFYSLPGYVERGAEAIYVTLAPKEGYAYHKDLEYTVRRLNESYVKNYTGMRLFIRIKP